MVTFVVKVISGEISPLLKNLVIYIVRFARKSISGEISPLLQIPVFYMVHIVGKANSGEISPLLQIHLCWIVHFAQKVISGKIALLSKFPSSEVPSWRCTVLYNWHHIAQASVVKSYLPLARLLLQCGESVVSSISAMEKRGLIVLPSHFKQCEGLQGRGLEEVSPFLLSDSCWMLICTNRIAGEIPPLINFTKVSVP